MLPIWPNWGPSPNGAAKNVAVTVRSIGKKLYKINRRTQEKISELNVVLHESFAGTKIVKAFGRERLEQERFDQVKHGSWVVKLLPQTPPPEPA